MKNIVKLMFVVAVALIMVSFLSSCRLTKQQRTDNRVIKKIDKIKAKYPASFQNVTTVRVDTVLQEVKVVGEGRVDTVKIESFITEFLFDTVNVPQFIDRFIEVGSDTVKIDTLAIHLWMSGVGLKYRLKKDLQYISHDVETINITKTEFVNKIPFWIWLIIGGLIFLNLIIYIKK